MVTKEASLGSLRDAWIQSEICQASGQALPGVLTKAG
jgi:hypothetical protein